MRIFSSFCVANFFRPNAPRRNKSEKMGPVESSRPLCDWFVPRDGVFRRTRKDFVFCLLPRRFSFTLHQSLLLFQNFQKKKKFQKKNFQKKNFFFFIFFIQKEVAHSKTRHFQWFFFKIKNFNFFFVTLLLHFFDENCVIPICLIFFIWQKKIVGKGRPTDR